jgi:hypothetical protein
VKVFIGSSSEQRGLTTELAALVGVNSHTSLRWTDPPAFPGGTITFDRLLELPNLVDAAVFVLSEDDRTWYRGNDIPSPRDNVVFEYGLFVGRLGPGRVVIVRKGKPEQPSDLAGLTYLTYDPANPADCEVRFQHWLDGVTQALGQRPSGNPALPDDAPIYRMLQVIDYLQLKGTPATPAAIFHLLSGEDRLLEAMLLRAIQQRWVQYEPDGNGLMRYRLAAEGQLQSELHALPFART